jgi:hypothetical protein
MRAPASLTVRLAPRNGLLRLHPIHADISMHRPEPSRQLRILGFVGGRSGKWCVYVPTSVGAQLEEYGARRVAAKDGGVYFLMPSSAVWWKLASGTTGAVTIRPEPLRELREGSERWRSS